MCVSLWPKARWGLARSNIVLAGFPVQVLIVVALAVTNNPMLFGDTNLHVSASSSGRPRSDNAGNNVSYRRHRVHHGRRRISLFMYYWHWCRYCHRHRCGDVLWFSWVSTLRRHLTAVASAASGRNRNDTVGSPIWVESRLLELTRAHRATVTSDTRKVYTESRRCIGIGFI